jgi:lipopolysaccharide transport system ATP-binding protein
MSQSQEINATKEVLETEDQHISKDIDYVDMRDNFINQTNLRNDIQIMPFESTSDSYGAGGARISNVFIEDMMTKKRLNFVVGGELVRLSIEAIAHDELDGIIMGFDLKNRHGQTVFGENTFLVYRVDPQQASRGQKITAIFEFRMPIMPVGDYALTVAIATGSQESHVQHHWVHDALILKSQSSRVCFGQVGIPMRNIEISVN